MADNRFSWTCRRVFPRPRGSAEKRRSGEGEPRRDHRAFRGKSRAAQRCSSGSQRSRSSCIFAPLSIVARAAAIVDGSCDDLDIRTVGTGVAAAGYSQRVPAPKLRRFARLSGARSMVYPPAGRPTGARNIRSNRPARCRSSATDPSSVCAPVSRAFETANEEAHERGGKLHVEPHLFGRSTETLLIPPGIGGV